MVDELTQESFQTGKAIVTVSVDILMSIAEACRKSEEKNPLMTEEQKDTLLKRVADKVTERYKATHGSLKSFNQDGKDVASLDVTDERAAKLLESTCKENHIPVDMKEIARADGSMTYTAFCEVRNIEQLASLLKLASEQILEEQKAMTKEVVLYNEKDEAVFSNAFVKESDIDYEKLNEAANGATRMEITDHKKSVLHSEKLEPNVMEQVKEKAKELSPKKEKSLAERIKDKKEQSKKQAKDKNREREKTKKKSRDVSL